MPQLVLSIWLMFLFPSLLLFTLLSFSAYQFHAAIKQTKNLEGETVSLGQVMELRANWSFIEDNITDNRIDISIESQRIDRANEFLPLRYNSLNQARDECVDKIRDVIKGIEASVNTRIVRCHNDEKTRLESHLSEENFSEVVKIIDYYVPEIEGVQAAIDNVRKLRDASIKKKLQHQNEIRTLSSSKDNLIRLSKIPNVSDFLNSANYLDPEYYVWPNSWLPRFLFMPTDMLVLIIVISMGALGGALQITRNFLSPEDLSNIDTYKIRFRYFFFQPFLGAITALAVFILVKAGVMVAGTSAGNAQAELNPFFISFLGIISGLMANMALETIVQLGEGWFRGSKRTITARWAHKLKELIETEAKRGVPGIATDAQVEADILKYVPVSKATLDQWIRQVEPVPPESQRLIAAYFRRHEREIFTDIPAVRDAGT